MLKVQLGNMQANRDYAEHVKDLVDQGQLVLSDDDNL